MVYHLTRHFVLARVICWRIFTRKLQSKHCNFLFFCAWAKIILIEYQQLRKYFKNNCLKTCVYYILDVYLYQQNEIVMQVTSKIFGTGTVVSQDATSVKVDFNGEVKNLALRFANLTNEDGTPFYTEPKKVSKPKKAPLPKIDYSKYSDAELVQMHNELMGELIEAKSEARKDLKTGTR